MACGPTDFTCQFREAILSILQMIFTPEVIFWLLAILIAVFILPRAGLKGVVFSVLIIGAAFIWFFGIPGTNFPPIRCGVIPGACQ